MKTAPKILAVAAVDVMVRMLLRPWMEALRDAGCEVHLACADTGFGAELRAAGFTLHEVPLRRTFNPFAHIRPLVALTRLIRRERYDIVTTHSPVGGAVGRLAAFLAGCPKIVYSVHGFYFHDEMNPATRAFFVVIEWLLGRITDWFMFVSEEDRKTAIRTGIARRPEQAVTIFNGVDTGRFSPRLRDGPRPEVPVIGIVGRIVREKGYREFAEMAAQILQSGRSAKFLVVGATLASDRDQFGANFAKMLEARGLTPHFTLAGFTKDVPQLLRSMDIFVLPSYREGFPRSVLEAMAAGLPVVTTSIRGCREAVVDGVTGLLVPPRDSKALTTAVCKLADDPEMAARMGLEGRKRVCERFEMATVQARFVAVVNAAWRQRAGRHRTGRRALRLGNLLHRSQRMAFAIAVGAALLSPTRSYAASARHVAHPAQAVSAAAFDWPSFDSHPVVLVNTNQAVAIYVRDHPAWFEEGEVVLDFAVPNQIDSKSAEQDYDSIRQFLVSRRMIVGTYISGTTVEPLESIAHWPYDRVPLDWMPGSFASAGTWPGDPRLKIVDLASADSRHALQQGVLRLWREHPAPLRFVDNAAAHRSAGGKQPWQLYCANMRELREIGEALGSRVVFNVALHPGTLSDAEAEQLINALGAGNGILLEDPWGVNVRNNPQSTQDAERRYRQLLDNGLVVIMLPLNLSPGELLGWVQTWRKPGDHLYLGWPFWKDPQVVTRYGRVSAGRGRAFLGTGG